jgi:hypothetical protein
MPPAVVALHEAAERSCGFGSVADVVHDMGRPTRSDIADELSSWISTIRDFSNSKIVVMRVITPAGSRSWIHVDVISRSHHANYYCERAGRKGGVAPGWIGTSSPRAMWLAADETRTTHHAPLLSTRQHLNESTGLTTTTRERPHEPAWQCLSDFRCCTARSNEGFLEVHSSRPASHVVVLAADCARIFAHRICQVPAASVRSREDHRRVTVYFGQAP